MWNSLDQTSIKSNQNLRIAPNYYKAKIKKTLLNKGSPT